MQLKLLSTLAIMGLFAGLAPAETPDDAITQAAMSITMQTALPSDAVTDQINPAFNANPTIILESSSSCNDASHTEWYLVTPEQMDSSLVHAEKICRQYRSIFEPRIVTVTLKGTIDQQTLSFNTTPPDVLVYEHDSLLPMTADAGATETGLAYALRIR
jgi:hypothetical protein